MGRIVLLLLLLAVLLAGTAAGRTWMVLPDSTGDAPTIQAGIDSASAGDTVSVGSGTYYEHDIALKSGILITSDTGTPDCVKISAQGLGPVFTCYQVDDTHIVGLKVAGGIHGMECRESDIYVTRCIFTYNGPAIGGGGVFARDCAAVFTECTFSHNYLLLMEDGGSGGGVFSTGGALSFLECVFSDNDSWAHGGGFGCRDSCSVVLEECLFVGNITSAWGGGAWISNGSNAEISQCTFVGNTVRGSGTGEAAGVHCAGASVVMDRCIVAFSQNGVGFLWNGYGTWPVLTCCDIYGNPDGDWVGHVADQNGVNGNFSEDPLFCNPEVRNFGLCSVSPCLDTDSCGTIGVYGAGGCTPWLFWTGIATDLLRDQGLGTGFAWVDYDDDGDLDISVTNRDTGIILFRNDSLTAEGFVDATPLVLAGSANSRGAAWGDYDNDGDLDLYVSNKGPNYLYRNDGNGDFVDVTAAPLDDSGTGHTASWADYDRDGDLDLYLVNNGPNRLFANMGAGVFTDVTSGPLGDPGSGRGMGWGDYDNDGDLDMYIANNDGSNVLLENEGGGVFTDVTTPALEGAGGGYGPAWGDYDNDGDLDLYVANEGANNLLRNDGGAFVDVTVSPLDDNLNSHSAAWGDYDLDGDLDLYVINGNGANGLYCNDADSFSVASPGCGYSRIADTRIGYSAGFGDFDRDGDQDIYIVNESKNSFYRNDPYFSSHWLEVELVGVLSNSHGQGARVTVIAAGQQQMREICGASGYASQGPLTAFFGLGSESLVDTLRIVWPSGVVQALTAVACDQVLEVVEDGISGLADNDPAEPAVLRLYPTLPNPFERWTSIRYDLPATAETGLAVYDASGRLVRTIVRSALKEPGRYTVFWDGRNEAGTPVAPGIYFCRLSAGSSRKIRRMVMLR